MGKIVLGIWFIKVHGMETWIKVNSCLEIKIKIYLILNKWKTPQKEGLICKYESIDDHGQKYKLCGIWYQIMLFKTFD